MRLVRAAMLVRWHKQTRTPCTVKLVAQLNSLSRGDDRSVQCKLCNIALFCPTFGVFGFPHVQLNTCQSCCFSRLTIAVGVQSRDVHTTPSSKDGSEKAAHLHLK